MSTSRSAPAVLPTAPTRPAPEPPQQRPTRPRAWSPLPPTPDHDRRQDSPDRARWALALLAARLHR